VRNRLGDTDVADLGQRVNGCLHEQRDTSNAAGDRHHRKDATERELLPRQLSNQNDPAIPPKRPMPNIQPTPVPRPCVG
jgi:hypothetical protein